MNRTDAEAAAERLRIALDLFAAGEEIKRQSLRRRFPHDGPKTIEERLAAWRDERPGAESGDAVGRPVDWSRRGAT